jgi:hypothetical protein
LKIFKPDTVITWHRKAFRMFWTWKIRAGKPGRPTISQEIRELIRRMSRENPGWGAPRIHGELLKLGIDIGETSVSKYLVRLSVVKILFVNYALDGATPVLCWKGDRSAVLLVRCDRDDDELIFLTCGGVLMVVGESLQNKGKLTSRASLVRLGRRSLIIAFVILGIGFLALLLSCGLTHDGCF